MGPWNSTYELENSRSETRELEPSKLLPALLTTRVSVLEYSLEHTSLYKYVNTLLAFTFLQILYFMFLTYCIYAYVAYYVDDHSIPL